MTLDKLKQLEKEHWAHKKKGTILEETSKWVKIAGPSSAILAPTTFILEVRVTYLASSSLVEAALLPPPAEKKM